MSALTTSNPDNANPTVHRTGSESSARSRYRLAAFLDEEDEDGFDGAGWELAGSSSSNSVPLSDAMDGVLHHEDAASSDSDDQTEPIDSQEIFGGC